MWFLSYKVIVVNPDNSGIFRNCVQSFKKCFDMHTFIISDKKKIRNPENICKVRNPTNFRDCAKYFTKYFDNNTYIISSKQKIGIPKINVSIIEKPEMFS